MVQKAMLLMLLVLIINALSIPSQKILQSKISQIFKGCDTLSGIFFLQTMVSSTTKSNYFVFEWENVLRVLLKRVKP